MEAAAEARDTGISLSKLRDQVLDAGIERMERGRIPDGLIRAGIRGLLKQRLREEARRAARSEDPVQDFIRSMEAFPTIAPAVQEANDQHYEVPPAFYRAVLGKHLKYSSAYFPSTQTTLDEAESAMLQRTCETALLQDGQRILELGCGWGSLTLWMAERFPRSQVVAVSNSRAQRSFILGRAAERGLGNLVVHTADMNDFEGETEAFDRVVSVEMFEHMRAWPRLLSRTCRWLAPGGKLFIHVFAHKRHPYVFEAEGASNWMGQHFFTGGIMPSFDLLRRALPKALHLEHQSWISGVHYQRTAEGWLDNLDRSRRDVTSLFAEHYGSEEAMRMVQRWRVFFMACAELWGFAGGSEWGVAHYRATR